MSGLSTGVYSGVPVVLWTTTALDLDLRAIDPTGRRRPPRLLVVGLSGTLDVRRLGEPATTITLPALPDGYSWPVQVAETRATSTARNVVAIY